MSEPVVTAEALLELAANSAMVIKANANRAPRFAER
jgi:hypothetical protein